MKRIHSIGNNKYVHLDSYPETHKTGPVTNFLMSLCVIGIAAMTAGAFLGVDITSPSTPHRYVDTSRTGS